MTTTRITRILDKHGIAYEVINGKVIAEENYTIDGILYSDSIDLTGFTKQQLYNWLWY